MLLWLERLYYQAVSGRLLQRDPRWGALVQELLHVLFVLIRETIRDRLSVRAAMLSYWTTVALVPLMLLGFALTGPLGLAEDTRDTVRHVLYDTILASSVEDVGAVLDELVMRTNLGTLGVIGVLSTMFIGSQLFFQVEAAYNDIFRARVDRSWILRFTLFYAALTLGPITLAAGFVLSGRLGAEGTVSWLARVVPVLLSTPVFVGAIRLLPCAAVSWRAALAGGATTALLFEFAKAGFGIYIDIFGTRDNLALIYGSVAFLPVFLLWTYVVWLLVLFGVEVAWLFQHRHSLLDAQRRMAADPHHSRRTPDAFFALSVMAAITAQFERRGGPSHPDELVAVTGGDPRQVQTVLVVLQDAGFIVLNPDRGALPARPPEQIPAAEVLLAWRVRAAPPLQGPAQQRLQETLARVGADLQLDMRQLALPPEKE